jgi:hypothetical protein
VLINYKSNYAVRQLSPQQHKIPSYSFFGACIKTVRAGINITTHWLAAALVHTIPAGVLLGGGKNGLPVTVVYGKAVGSQWLAYGGFKYIINTIIIRRKTIGHVKSLWAWFYGN